MGAGGVVMWAVAVRFLLGGILVEGAVTVVFLVDGRMRGICRGALATDCGEAR